MSRLLPSVLLAAVLVCVALGAPSDAVDEVLPEVGSSDVGARHTRPPTIPEAFSMLRPDPAVFKWEGQATPGGKACGFLTAPVSYLSEHLIPGTLNPRPGFPTIKVKFCAAFARTQPAPKGSLLYHCGGPGSTSSCDLDESFLDLVNIPHARQQYSDLANNYNRFTVDQRGLGASLPSFMPCSALQTKAFESSRIVQGSCQAGTSLLDVDPVNDACFGELLASMVKANEACFELPQYKFKGPPDPAAGFPQGQDLHFLMNSGTQSLINDINKFRVAIGADKISMYVGSYGTAVGGAFATTFTEHVDRFVSNSPISPMSDGPEYAFERARGNQLQLDYQLGVCERDPKCRLRRFVGEIPAFRDMSTMMSEIQHAVYQLPKTRFSTLEQYKVSIDARKRDPKCDAFCREALDLLSLDDGEDVRFDKILKRLRDGSSVCQSKLGDVDKWGSDPECERLRDNIVQTSNIVSIRNHAGKEATCGLTTPGGMNGALLSADGLTTYMPYAYALVQAEKQKLTDKAKEELLLEACRIQSIVLTSTQLLKKFILPSPEKEELMQVDDSLELDEGKCLVYDEHKPQMAKVGPCLDACIEGTCLSNLLFRGLSVTKQNWLNMPTPECGSLEFGHKGSTVKFSGVPGKLQDALALQGVCNRGGGIQVNSQDRAKHFQQQLTAVNELHRAQNTFSSIAVLLAWVSKIAMDFAWQTPNPLPTMGSPNLGGIIIGSLYDPNTAYQWAQEMKGHFPEMSMISTGFVSHFMSSNGGNAAGVLDSLGIKAAPYASPCMAHVYNFFMDDTRPLPQDGLFCPAPKSSVTWKSSWEKLAVKDFVKYEP